jgi:DNA replication and repair protein RecF
LIRDGALSAGIFAEYSSSSHNGKIEANILGDGRRSIKVNGMPVKRMSELMGVVNSVVFAPEDLRTIKEAPSLRRKMMDVEISKIHPRYYIELQKYSTVLKNKNKLLKEQKIDVELFAVYNEALIKHACVIIEKRLDFTRCLHEYAEKYYKYLAGGGEKMEILYKVSADIGSLPESLQKKVNAAEKREREMRMSLVGPHREDIDILINDRDAKLYASQGQQRTAMLSIKLACAKIAEKDTGEMPVLLLDDVFSELDVKRRERLLDAVKELQVFITATDAVGGGQLGMASFYTVKDAVILPN